MAVVATAGHVDHGKSALVRALTGIEPDRYDEERRRGMTLDLGFAHARSADGTVLDIVDVPGHVDYLRTMIAGAALADVALLVVDAVEGPRAQTLEHLRVVHLGTVRCGVVAITRCDLVDDQRIAEVRRQIDHMLVGSTIDWRAVVPTSAVSGGGLPDLVIALADASRRADDDGEVRIERATRLVVDRSFHVVGAGTVITGTIIHNC